MEEGVVGWVWEVGLGWRGAGWQAGGHDRVEVSMSHYTLYSIGRRVPMIQSPLACGRRKRSQKSPNIILTI